jgi:transcriptional regulator with GAF, ATPase, and Fis domain
MGADDEGKQHGPSTVSLEDARADAPRGLGRSHRLVVWNGGVATPRALPASGQVTIGRTAPADLIIDSATVSRAHARLTIDQRGVHLEDLGSLNATRVNGERVEEGERRLAYGDVILFGNVLAVLEEQPDQSGSSPPAAAEPPPEGFLLQIGARKLVVADPVMQHVYSQLRRLAQSQLAVLIVGETGVGKDLAANALHAWSRRHAKPFVSINCAALPESLAESELFGHERGAFSGATRDKIGLLESASGGTAFLDEIGDLPPAIQPKLLRVIETQKVTRVGSVSERPIDVRIVTATHRDLRVEVDEGRFREDLYYRVGAAVVSLPPLRERPRELPLLVRRFLAEACAQLGRSELAVSDDAMARLLAHRWPGNVRELKNLMEYFAALVDGPLTGAQVAADLGRGAAAGADTGGRSLRENKDEFERRHVEAALAASGGNKTQAAKMLQMPLRTLKWKLKRWGGTGET